MNTSIVKMIKRSGLLMTLAALMLPGISLAQQYYDPGLLQKTIDRKPVAYQPPGARLGSFKLHAGAELAYESNDNIFYLNNLEIDDSIFHIRPWANLNSDWSRHELNLNFFADIGKYNDWGSQDYEDWVTSLDGRIDVRRGSAFNYKASYMQLHEDRSDPTGRQGVKPTTFSLDGLNVGYSHAFNRLTAALNYSRADHDYDNNKNLAGDIIDNQDRDRSRDELALRLDYDLSGQRGVFFSAAANSVDYDQKFDRGGYERSSDGYNVRAGVSWDKTGVLVGDLYVEYLEQEYDDARFDKVDGFGIGAKLDWTPTELTNVSFLARNGPQETILEGSSGYYSSLYSVRVQHELRRNWLLNGRVSYTDNDYGIRNPGESSLTDTQVTRAGAGVSYLFNRNFYLSGGYVYESQDANLSRYEYSTNRWFLTFGAEL